MVGRTHHLVVGDDLSTHIGPVDFGRAPHDAAIEFCTGPTPELDAVLVLPLALRPHASPTVLRRQGVRRARGGWSRADLARVLTREPLIRHTTVPEGWDGWLAAARLQDEVQAARGPQYDLLSMALNGAIAGLGVALLPAYVVGAALRSGQLVALSPIEWSSQKGYWLRCPHAKAGLAALRSFREWLPRASLAA